MDGAVGGGARTLVSDIADAADPFFVGLKKWLLEQRIFSSEGEIDGTQRPLEREEIELARRNGEPLHAVSLLKGMNILQLGKFERYVAMDNNLQAEYMTSQRRYIGDAAFFLGQREGYQKMNQGQLWSCILHNHADSTRARARAIWIMSNYDKVKVAEEYKVR